MEKCKVCGSNYDINEWVDSNITRKMKTFHICFECAFWYCQKDYDDIPGTGTALITEDYSHFRDVAVLDDNEFKTIRGFGGREFIYHKIDDGTLHKTNNLWHQGTIPLHLRFMFKPNVKFVGEKEIMQYMKPIDIKNINVKTVKVNLN